MFGYPDETLSLVFDILLQESILCFTYTEKRKQLFLCMLTFSLHSKHFRGVWEHRKTEERDFRYFACAENGARAEKRKMGASSPCNSLLPNHTETLAVTLAMQAS